MEDATRARDFMRSLDEIVSTSIDDLQYGLAYFNESFPRYHGRTNFVRASSWLDAAKLAGLLNEVERAQRTAGLEHRKLVFEEQRHDHLAPLLAPLRFEPRTLAILAHRGSPWAAPPGHRLTELEPEQATEARRMHLMADSRANAVAVEQELQAEGLVAERIGVRWFAAFDNDQPVAICAVYADGQVAQLEGLSTLGAYRKRGHGYAVLAAALHAAAQQQSFVFTMAEAAGWQQQWLERLGFEHVATRTEALQVVGARRA